jgi:hypothetical protein
MHPRRGPDPATSPTQPQFATQLIGHWTITRRLADLRTGDEGHFEGVATIDADRWIEHGHLKFGAYDGPAGRRLRITPDGRVTFDDGRPFHRLAPRAEHRCGEDLYEAEYRVLGPDAFDVVWTVTGPNKHQRLESAYRRATVTRKF